MRTQDAPIVYDLNASIYIWKRKACFEQIGPFCKKTFFYEMPYSRSIDIDSLTDFKMVEFLEKIMNKFKNFFNIDGLKAYVVGGNGLIGTEIVKALEEFNAKVTVFDLNKKKQTKNEKINYVKFDCSKEKI